MPFGAGLALLYVLILAAKFSLWQANVLMNDWAFYNTSFWNTNFRDLWMFSHDRYIQFGYPSYLNEHFAPLLLVIAALYHIVPWSGAALATLCVPIAPVAPARFSTTTFCPSAACNCTAISRATMSPVPPGA